MIKYKNTITFDLRHHGDWQVDTDKGDIYKTSRYTDGKTLVTSWWADQHQSDLRSWQKDIVVGYMIDTFGDVELFNLYKSGNGYSQPHDMCVAYSPNHGVWCFSTEQDFWIQHNQGGNVIFERKNSIGSILQKHTRIKIGEIFDILKQASNPNNIAQTIGR